MRDIAEEISIRGMIESDARYVAWLERELKTLIELATQRPRRRRGHFDQTAWYDDQIKTIIKVVERRVRNASELGLTGHLYMRDALGSGKNFFHYLENNASVMELKLDEDAANLLWQANIETIGELCSKSRAWLVSLTPNDDLPVREIERALSLCRRELAE